MKVAVPYFYAITIDPADIDHMAHVNNARYLAWVQDAVTSHWGSIAPPDAVRAYLWVALKHEITYHKPAFLNDLVIAKVLIERVHGARAFYKTIIHRGEELIVEVYSSWCCVDAGSRRPVRLSQHLVNLFLKSQYHT